MRSIPGPTFNRSLLIALCAGVVLAAGCARKEPAATASKPRPLFVDGRPAPKAASKLAAAAKEDPKRPKIEFTFDAPTGKSSQRGVTLRWDEKNGTQMTASAKSGSFNEVTQVGTLLDFSAKLYENGKLTAALSAPQATADTAKRTVTVTGGVTLRSLERKTVVKASWIKWYANQHRVVGVGGVHMESLMESRAMNVDAAAFQADTALKTIKLMDSAKGLNL